MKQNADQDSDSIYTTNQPNIVEYAKYCYANYPTIVNNIPKDKNKYRNEPSEFARMDNNLSKSQTAIGESSNIAQLALTYTYNFAEKKFDDYVCILSVLAQAAIDSSKRAFDVDVNDEIKRIKRDMDVKKNGYPKFWGIIKKDFNKSRINKELTCPMNYLFDLEFQKFRSPESTLPIKHFFKQYELDTHRRKSMKVEELIEKYTFDLYGAHTMHDEDIFLLRDDFDEIVAEIRNMYISKSYLGLFSWLVNRAFTITSGQIANKNNIMSTLEKNKSALIKILYTVNPECLLKVFSNNIKS